MQLYTFNDWVNDSITGLQKLPTPDKISVLTNIFGHVPGTVVTGAKTLGPHALGVASKRRRRTVQPINT